MADEPTSPATPSNFGFEILIGPGVTLGKAAYDAWTSGRPEVKVDDPLRIAVVESATANGAHALHVLLANLGAHTVYIDAVDVTDPKGGIVRSAQLLAARDTVLGPPFGHADAVPPKPLPARIPSGSRALLEIAVAQLPAERLSNKPFGTLRIAFTVLGVAQKGLGSSVEFAVR